MHLIDKLTANSVRVSGPRATEIGDCLVWTGKCNPTGYGQIVTGHATWSRVHRVAWVLRHGPIPPETPHVLHYCDNPPCFEDSHLWLGTHAQNMADRDAKGRARGRFSYKSREAAMS